MLTAPVASVSFIDVGQGDCTLLVDRSSGRAVLIDCPAGRENAALRALQDAGGPDLDTIIITHWDTDHYGGVLALASVYPAQRLFYNHAILTRRDRADEPRSLAALKRLFKLFPDENQIPMLPSDGPRSLGSSTFRFLSPTHADVSRAIINSDKNRSSGVTVIEAAGTSVVVGADADIQVWRRCVTDELQVQVLRWPHHGAAPGDDAESIDNLLAMLNPEAVIVSCGTGNSNGHPHVRLGSVPGRYGRLLCTQVTEKCHPELAKNEERPCAGTVTVSLGDGGTYEIDPDPVTHASTIDGWTQPMCRRGSGRPELDG